MAPSRNGPVSPHSRISASGALASPLRRCDRMHHARRGRSCLMVSSRVRFAAAFGLPIAHIFRSSRVSPLA
eukprot:3506435-Alexandrium_andersonii.AAC.1